MANYTQGDTRPVLQPADLAPYQTNGSLVLDSRRTRPLWFDGRFLAARDFAREQNYFLQREADLARAPGFGAIDGLLVNSASSPGQAGGATAITIQAGRGVTPAGEIVRVPGDLTVQLADLTETASLDVQFGVSAVQVSSPATRTGLYVVALQPVQFTANPITAYPTTVQGSRSTHDGDMVEATAIVLVPYPGPSNNNGATTLQAALARQTFATGNPGSLSDSLLPLAMLSLQGGAIDWLDPYLVRRDMGVEYTGLRFGLTDPATQQAFLLQYDTQLQQAVNSFTRQKLPASFAATDYFQALPPAGLRQHRWFHAKILSAPDGCAVERCSGGRIARADRGKHVFAAHRSDAGSGRLREYDGLCSRAGAPRGIRVFCSESADASGHHRTSSGTQQSKAD